MNVNLLKREERAADFTPVRPGLRYGPAPLSKRTKVRSSPLDRWVLRSRSRFMPAGISHSVTWLVDIRQRIVDMQSVRADQCHAKFKHLANVLHGKGHTDRSLNDALANSACVAKQTLELDPHDVQLIAARELLRGRFVEMGTGEGKTLTMALAAAVSALDGTPVHVLTSSDYLAQRDAEWLTPFYSALGLSAAFVLPEMSDHERRTAYRSDVVHVTGQQVAFDWLRDCIAIRETVHRLSTRLGNLAHVESNADASSYEPLLRGLCLAIVDEADSLLIDEARTPMVLAAPMNDSMIQREECVVALTLARLLHEGVEYTVAPGMRVVKLTAEGERSLDTLASRVDGLWRAARYRNEKVRNALSVLHCWYRDIDYVVRDDRIELVDPYTGRALPDRRLQQGLHMLLELKERCEATPENDVVASIPFQSFFLNYVRLSGMSGTLREVRAELACVYGVDVVSLQPERPSRLQILPAKAFPSTSEQMVALVKDVQQCLIQGRPVLVGTRTVEQSDTVSAELTAHHIAHNLLNASQDANEAAVVSQAGTAGQVTVATNMAGRGTDICLGPDVRNSGGLHVISLAFNDSYRLDRQLAGRAGRQGDPGTFVRLLSLEDQSLINEMPRWIVDGLRKIMLHPKRAFSSKTMSTNGVDAVTTSSSVEAKNARERRSAKHGNSIANHIALLLINHIQRKIERRHTAERQRALDASRQLVHHIGIGSSNEISS